MKDKGLLRLCIDTQRDDIIDLATECAAALAKHEEKCGLDTDLVELQSGIRLLGPSDDEEVYNKLHAIELVLRDIEDDLVKGHITAATYEMKRAKSLLRECRDECARSNPPEPKSSRREKDQSEEIREMRDYLHRHNQQDSLTIYSSEEWFEIALSREIEELCVTETELEGYKRTVAELKPKVDTSSATLTELTDYKSASVHIATVEGKLNARKQSVRELKEKARLNGHIEGIKRMGALHEEILKRYQDRLGKEYIAELQELLNEILRDIKETQDINAQFDALFDSIIDDDI